MGPMIDLDTELRNLFHKEQVLAFFDLQLPNGADPPLTGVCSISKPKTDQKAAHYFSLLFLIDTSPTAGWERIHEIFKQVPWELLAQRIPGVETVLSLPHLRPGGESYCQEIDIFLQTGSVLSKGYVRSRLVPAVTQLCGCQPGEIVFWDKTARVPPPAKNSSALVNCEQDALPFSERVRRWLGIP